MAKSDLDEPVNSPSEYTRWKMARSSDDTVGENDKEIHSGHFMVSSLVDNGEDDAEDDRVVKQEPQGYDFAMANKDTNKSYKFGTRSTIQLAIDASLTKLFECMTLAYSGKLTSPKWKNFKGIKVPLKDKIRLNNIIWREWHMQYIQGNRPIICQFEPPISEKMHIKAEAVVLEGKYWKRRLESVTAEYKKWRMFWRERSKKESRDDSFIDMALHMDRIESRRHSASCRVTTPKQLTPQLDHYMTDEDFYMDFSDTLFSSLNQPFSFPNPREICQLGNADIIQPGLMQLQPSLDDFMDTLEPLPSLNEMMGMTSRSSSSSLLTVPCTMPRQLPLPMETSLSYNNTNQTFPPSSNTQTPVSEPLPITAQPQQVNLVTLSDLQNQNRTQLHQQMEGERVRNLSGDAQIQLEIESAATQINSLLDNARLANATLTNATLTNATLANATLANVTLPSSTIGNTALESAMLISDSDPNKTFDNVHPQIISLVLNPTLTNNMAGTVTSEVTQQTPVLKTGNTQFSAQLPSRPTVQQLLNQQNLASQASKTVTIIQNTSLQALLQGLGQSQPSVQQQTSTPLATVLETNVVQPTVQNISLKQEPVVFDLGSTSRDVPSSLSMFSAAVTPSAPSTPHSIKQARNRSEGTIQNILNSARSHSLSDSRRRSAGSTESIIAARKDGEFLIPSTTMVPKLRPRSLAPAPPGGNTLLSNPPVTISNNVLAQLLTHGGSLAIKREKNEQMAGNLSAFKPIQPAPASLPQTSCITTNTATMAMASDFMVTATDVSDFQKNLLLAAVNQVIGSGNVQLSDLNTTAIQSPITSLSDPSSPPYNINSPQFIIPGAGSPTSDLGSRSRHTSNDSTGSGYKDDYDFQNALKPFRPKNEVERAQYREMRRASHINAEQKRRGNIKVGFEMLHQLVPALKMTASSKSSIANTLGKAAEYCRKLKQERSQMQDEAEILKQEIESLNNAISTCQSQLPATGVPVTRQRADQMREKFDNYVRGRTQQNWKFWIFSIIIRNLLDSYNKTVSTSSMDELCRTVLAWLEQHCSLVALRPTVLNSLRQLCTTTSILSDPSKVPQQASQAVQKPGDLSTAMGALSSINQS